MSVETVKIQARPAKSGRYTSYAVTLPRKFVDELGWKPGDTLIARVMKITIDGIERTVIVYYKP